jgi:hypothetical protein
MTISNRLAKAEARTDDPRSIEYMPGYVPPKLRKHWTPSQHCQFANDHLAWSGNNEIRRNQGLRPVRWVLHDGRIAIEEVL